MLMGCECRGIILAIHVRTKVSITQGCSLSSPRSHGCQIVRPHSKTPHTVRFGRLIEQVTELLNADIYKRVRS